MPKIKELLSLNLDIDIKNVIDLEEQVEEEIRYEIDNYIITENIGRHLSTFASKYNSNIKETGVWLSGFYGSGKSYFGKMLGYLLGNRDIMGTPAIERIIPRLSGLNDAALIENDLRKFASSNNRVISLDIAKQNTDKGLAFTLFRNFLKSLGFLDSVYGYMEYQLFLDGDYPAFKERVKQLTGEEWQSIRASSMRVPSTIRKVLTAWKYTEQEYDETVIHLNSIIDSFSASKLKDELSRYLEKQQGETIVFIFDEASEAISQKKFTLLDLEGLSESLSAIASRVWTIAIAQEKLDDVINNNSISKSQLTKVTDRFKTKIHLESTEVDVIIRSRLLQKSDEGQRLLEAFFDKNAGKIADITNLKASIPTKSESKALFSIYYPFHHYQFRLLQNFLFASNALTASQVAARGMIITTFDVLRNKLGKLDAYNFATAFDICDEAQTAPPAALVNKYDLAREMLKESPIDGIRLLKAIHFLSVSELVATTAENITKVYISTVDDYYSEKPQIEEALTTLTTAKVLLESNNAFKITSDLETKLLDEMKDFTVEHFIRKKELVARLQKNSYIRSIAAISDNSVTYNFHVTTDLGDELISSSNKDLQIEVCSLYSVTEKRTDFIDTIKQQTQNIKHKITLVPDNAQFSTISRLIDEILRFSYMDDKYKNDSDPLVRQIIRDFATMRDEREKDLLNLITTAYTRSAAVYLFNAIQLGETNFKAEVNTLQKKVLDNVFYKRPSKQLSEALAISIIKERQNDKLPRFNDGNDFAFFDSNGNFVGDALECMEAVTAKIKSQYLSGKDLELELKSAPTGYEYGTVATLVAVLFRAGRLTARFNAKDIFSYRDDVVESIFSSSRNFQKASFKSLSKSLTTAQKSDMVTLLRALKIEEVTKERVDWNSNDFALIEAIRALSEYYINAVRTMKKTVTDFEPLFGSEATLIGKLHEFSGKVTEANFLDTADNFLLNQAEFEATVRKIEKIEKFIKSNLQKARFIKRFVDELKIELEKANVTSSEIQDTIARFDEIYSRSVVEGYREILVEGQKLKDFYHIRMVEANKKASDANRGLLAAATALIAEIKSYPETLNPDLLRQVQSIKEYAEASAAYLTETEATLEFPLDNIRDFIESLPTMTMNGQEIADLSTKFETLYQSNNDLEEFCIRNKINPINVWYLFKKSGVLPQQRAKTIAMEFLADLIREILNKDDDGIVPLVRNTGEEILIDRIEKKFEEKGLTSAQFAAFPTILGKEINDYINNNFFADLSDHLNLFMYLPKTPFIWHITSGPRQGFDAFIIIYKWSRDKLFTLKSVYIEKRETALRNRQSDLLGEKSAQAEEEKDTIFHQLKEIESLRKKIDELLSEGYDPKLDDGVGKNIAPLQKRGIIAYEVLNPGQLKKYLNADW